MTTIQNSQEKLLDALDLASLAPEEQEALLVDINELVYKSAMVRLVERMDDAARGEFAKLVEGDASEEAVEAFLAAAVPDADQVVLEAVQEITDDILAATGTNTN